MPQILRFITGAGGTGKSYLLKLIRDRIRLILDVSQTRSALILAAPTGVAARNINGTTLHRAFKLPVERGGIAKLRALEDEVLNTFRDHYKRVSWIIIDEISMVSAETMLMIHNRILQLFPSDNERLHKPFGGLNVLLFGDLYQLKPVNGHWVFEQTAINNPYFWPYFQFVELTTNVRQGKDHRMLELCNNIRVGAVTTADIEVLKTRYIDNFANNAYANSLRIVPTNALANQYNAEKLEAFQVERARMLQEMRISGQPVYTISAVDTHLDPRRMDEIVDPMYVPKDSNKCGGIPTKLGIAPGVRIMLRRNISLANGLVNGAMGVITDITWPNFNKEQLIEGQLPEYVDVLFDDAGAHKIKPITIEFDGNKKVKIKRTMLPFILCWAVTAHKTQG